MAHLLYDESKVNMTRNIHDDKLEWLGKTEVNIGAFNEANLAKNDLMFADGYFL